MIDEIIGEKVIGHLEIAVVDDLIKHSDNGLFRIKHANPREAINRSVYRRPENTPELGWS